ncbi:MAG: gliding motility-associated C-terminal domain-containing protein, partial [Bacteroidales bacterium]
VSICRGDTIRLHAESPTSQGDQDFIWENGLYRQGERLSPEETTTYMVEMMDDNGCMGRDSITIVVEEVPEISITGLDILTCEDPEIRLGTEVNAFGHDYTVRWSSETMEEDFTGDFLYVDEPGLYQATATTRGGCAASDSVMVEQDLSVYIPNAFRPESDIRVNQTFMPLFYECEPQDYILRIFDRYGNEVFNTDDVNGRGWDGVIDGRRAAPGAYTYQVEYNVGDGHKQRQGTVYLVR